MFAELREVEFISSFQDDLLEVEVLGEVGDEETQYPVHGLTIGSKDPSAPTLGLFAGVHGLEKVGTHVVLAYLKHLLTQMKWDQDLRTALSHCRICSIPLINPWGMDNFRRSNATGVDLMRNAPVEMDNTISRTFLVSGHRFSSVLPWYRGQEEGPMEKENQLVDEFVKKNIFQSKAALSIDFHSGFGMKDRLWYPYSKTKEPFPHHKQALTVARLLDETFAHHVYKVEQQSDSYTIMGDLWDYLYDESRKVLGEDSVYIPWTLEMGSWIWVKKNPMQLLNIDGLFNPVVSHRYDRTMRRHLLLIDFFFRMVRNNQVWIK
jgi:predicted deacylase